MSTFSQLLLSTELAPPQPPATAAALAEELSRAAGLNIYPGSLAARGGALFFLGRRDRERFLGIVHAGAALTGEFWGETRDLSVEGKSLILTLVQADHANALALRRALPFTAPTRLGLTKSIGCGDRLGLATPGHLRAVRKGSMAPILAQQSIREMTRTQRTPDQVMDAATWGVFQEGWRAGFGADADHLKTPEDVDRCLAAGFVFYTIDPGDHVDNAADRDDAVSLHHKVETLPWEDLEASPADLRRTYLDRRLDVGDFAVSFSEEELLRAAAKYSRAVAHTVRMYRHLADGMGDRPFELEMSVDETETPTSIPEHYFVAAELKRLGVQWVSLAPRYIGRFEKGVDYIGDLGAFEADFARHVAIARALGPYKLSLHSGSDKFSIYPIAARLAGDLVHLKTAGTSYLEALRAIASVDPGLFREIMAFAFERYGEDRASYHVSADPSAVPRPERLRDDELAPVLDNFHGREMLHVTFGSVLTTRGADDSYRFRDRLLAALEADEEAHYAALEAHFDRHIVPFST
jgi:hypothetical protein